MANFKTSIEILLKHEGGYVKNAKDAGGETKFGISKRSYPHLDIKNLTRQQAIDIYKCDFWDKLRMEEVVSDDVATKIFDTAVNTGIVPCVKIAQRVCNLITSDKIKVDGIIGSKTLSVVNSIGEQVFLEQFRDLQKLHYERIVKKDPTQQEFLEGWLKRAAS